MTDDTTSPLPEILTPQEAAEYLGIHPETLRRLLRDGVIPGGRVGGQWRILRSALTGEGEVEFPRLLLEREVAGILRVDPGTLAGQRRRGQLPGALGFRLPTGDIRYDAAEVAAFIDGLKETRPSTA